MAWLPSFNACWNLLSASFLVLGYFFIRRKEVTKHRFCMFGALLSSAFFLAGYLTYHAVHGTTRFMGEGFIRPLYFFILISHTVLAMAVVPLVAMTFLRALRGEIEKHRALARITWPVWLYVSVTGVVIYGMLYWMRTA